MIARAFLALALLVAGLLAILDVGGTAADVAGLLAIAVALLAFSRAVFRLAEGKPCPAEREPDARRLG